MRNDERTDPIRYAECGREVSKEEAEREGWGYWSDGVGERHPYARSARGVSSEAGA